MRMGLELSFVAALWKKVSTHNIFCFWTISNKYLSTELHHSALRGSSFSYVIQYYYGLQNSCFSHRFHELHWPQLQRQNYPPSVTLLLVFRCSHVSSSLSEHLPQAYVHSPSYGWRQNCSSTYCSQFLVKTALLYCIPKMPRSSGSCSSSSSVLPLRLSLVKDVLGVEKELETHK